MTSTSQRELSMNTPRPQTFRMRWESWGTQWRSSYWFVTFVVWLGILTDLVVYSIIVPVIPFELESLGYSDVSTLTGWLMFTYSAGLALSTVFVSMLAEKYRSRQVPLLIGNVLHIGAQIMFMEAHKYWLMCFARVLQGIASTMVWSSDVTPETQVGRQLGLAISGLTIGPLLAIRIPGPFILGTIFAFIDLIGRVLIIERKLGPSSPDEEKADAEGHEPVVETQVQVPSFARVLITLGRSPRAVVAGFIGMAYGLLTGLQDTIISLHLNKIWGLKSSKIGLIMLAAVIPTILAPPIFGWLSDRHGTAWIMLLGILFTIPWCGAMIVEKTLGLFIASYALQSFFMSSVVSPLSAELAAVGRSIEGIGCECSFIGPVISGQFYDRLARGFMASYVCLMAVLGCGAVLTLFYSGDVSVAFQIYHRGPLKLVERRRNMT
ncbi:MFS general substrate transporter [Hymenopellis radicata]|nr:MFS general substrate transporter [Hymenopellis radicata]